MASRIDVSIEHKQPPPEPEGKRHPNTCPKCQSHYRDDELEAALWVCSHCGHHFPMRAPARIAHLTDPGSFQEEAAELRSEDPLAFFDIRPYTERLAEAEVATGLGDAMVIGQATLDEHPIELAVMDFAFMGGSMGSVVGEKFSRACDSAAERGAPLVSVSASGGARMQEGILALMQLPKTVCAVEELHDAGQPLISVLAHPTTGGLLASFASLGDVMLAEPGRADVLRRPARRPADDPREASRRLRPRRVEPPPRPRRRGGAARGAAVDPVPSPPPLRWQVRPSSGCASGSAS